MDNTYILCTIYEGDEPSLADHREYVTKLTLGTVEHMISVAKKHRHYKGYELYRLVRFHKADSVAVPPADVTDGDTSEGSQ